jgi:hypothetical protein
MAVQHAGHFDAACAFAIEDEVIANPEAPDRRIQLWSLAACPRRRGQELALLVDLVDEAIGCRRSIVLRHENPDVREIGLSEL